MRCLVALATTRHSLPAALPAAENPDRPLRPSLELPANPSIEDIFRARIFDEPLVPVEVSPLHWKMRVWQGPR
jgi:hypothetical protein